MFETILTKFVERIATASGTRPQVVIRPLPGPVPYDGKTGVHCFVGPDEPFDTAGAGRWGSGPTAAQPANTCHTPCP